MNAMRGSLGPSSPAVTIVTVTLLGQDHCPHFMDEDTEVQNTM